MNRNSFIVLTVFFLLVYFTQSFVKAAIDKTQSTLEKCHGATDDNNNCKKEQPRLALPYINPVKVGHEHSITLSNGKKLTMRTLSLAPPIFEIPDFFSIDECELVMDIAKKKGMAESPVVKDKRIFQNETTHDVFVEWDVNKDGFVDIDEMMMLRGNSDLYITEEEIKTMMKELAIDNDVDGKINFEEFQKVTADAIKQYFERLRKENPPLRSRNSKQAWLWHDEDELLQYEDLFEDYHDRFSKITKLPTKLVEDNEPLQVVHYPQDGHYHCHYDSDVLNTERECCVYEKKNCRFCRYLTVAVFLNDVESGGELAFPVADNSSYNWEVWTKESYAKCNMVKHCSKSNLIVKPKAGTAVLFYNHLHDKKTQWFSALDPRALIGDCQVKKGEKWIAYSWMSIAGDGISELNSWKMGSNLLSKNNFNKEVISSLEANFIPTEEPLENRYTKEVNSLGDASSSNVEGPPKAVRDSDHVEITTEHYDALEGINMKEVKKEFLNQNVETEPSKQNAETEPSTSSSKLKPLEVDGDPNALPTGPKVHLGSTPAPLPLPLETMTLKEPIKPKLDSEPLPPVEGHRVLKSIMLLLDELDQVELEIVARNLHSRLKLVCVPLMINPMGGIR